MVAYSLAQRLTPTLALVAAGALGMVAALAGLLLPGGLFESVVITSGIAAFIPAAEPPLGTTARICLAVFAGGGAALLAFAGLSALIHFTRPRASQPRRPNARRADRHPDAPTCEPIYAGRDLGFEADALTDLPSRDPLDFDANKLPSEPMIARGVPAPQPEPASPPLLRAKPPRTEPAFEVQPLPADLDQPLAAFDPAALLETPLAAPRPLAPLCRAPAPPVFAEGERFETFDLAPRPTEPVAAPAAPITAPETVATVHSLLDRLERGIARRTQVTAPQPAVAGHGLETTLETLRRMAVRA